MTRLREVGDAAEGFGALIVQPAAAAAVWHRLRGVSGPAQALRPTNEAPSLRQVRRRGTP